MKTNIKKLSSKLTKKISLTLLGGFMAFSFAGVSGAQALDYFQEDLDENFVEDVLNIFPEGKVIPNNLINFAGDPNIHLYQEAEVFITFIDEGAGFQNTFGFFTYEDANEDGEISPDEILSETVVFANASKQGAGGDLLTGDTVNLGKFSEGTNIGFFLIANGKNNPNGNKYYTIDTLNPKQERHLALVAMNDYDAIVLGIEDLPLNRSDLDFNDVLFTFRTNPIEAIREIIKEGNIPNECDLIDEEIDREDCQEELEEKLEEREREVIPQVEVPEEIVETVPTIEVQSVEEDQSLTMIEGSGTVGCHLNHGPASQSSWLWVALAGGVLFVSRRWQLAKTK